MAPVLPPELESQIVHFAMHSALLLQPENLSREMRLTLSLVASRFKFWAEQVRQEGFIIEHEYQGPIFLEGLQSGETDPAQVKFLCVTSHINKRIAGTVVGACRNLRILALWTDCRIHPDLFSELSRLRLSQLSIEFRQFMLIPTAVAWTSGLTHLDLVMWSQSYEPGVLELVEGLQRLPGLTHLSLMAQKTRPEHVDAVLDACRGLQVIIILESGETTDSDGFANNLKYEVDPRVVVLTDPDDEDIVPEWIAQVRGEANLWTTAEGMIAERRAATYDTCKERR